MVFLAIEMFKPCKDCWDKNDLAWMPDNDSSSEGYKTWDGKESYPFDALQGRVLDEPFVLKDRTNANN